MFADEGHEITINGDKSTKFGVLRDLKPYTTYMVKVAVKVGNNLGQWSDSRFNTTLEAG